MFKSLLLKCSWLYELVQTIRDNRFHRDGVRKASFSQHSEDADIFQILNASGATGPYVDVGSNHPFRLSNTYLLYLNGWRGICIDALPRFKPLYQKWRPEDSFECLGVGEKPGKMTLFEFESDVLSTFDPILAKQYQQDGYKLRKEVVTEIKTLDSILEIYSSGKQISLLSIDVEGHELSVLKSTNLQYWKPAFICLEALTADGQRNDEAIAYLLDSSYKVEKDLGLNIIFARNEPDII